jgi:dTDP-4-amino-4,6-dideoxygalactose transaminase
VLSFHATKVFNTFEGGAIVCPDEKTKLRIDKLKNFGHDGETSVIAPGINGKMSEFNAALGLLQLKYIDDAITKRMMIDGEYRKLLNGIKGIKCLDFSNSLKHNYSYFPILIQENFPISRDIANSKLKELNIFTRRYFYPLISEFPMYKSLPSAAQDNLPVATLAANQILCLPIYPDLPLDVVKEVANFFAAQ